MSKKNVVCVWILSLALMAASVFAGASIQLETRVQTADGGYPVPPPPGSGVGINVNA